MSDYDDIEAARGTTTARCGLTDTKPKAVAKHTPGPWKAWDDDGTGTSPCVLADQPTAYGNFYVCQANIFADAVLISAAPDLLAACQLGVAAAENLAEATDPGDYPGLDDSIAILRAAIAKAQGN